MGRRKQTSNSDGRATEAGAETEESGDTRIAEAAGAGTPPWIVGMGASAGGLEAFRNFLENMPSDSDFAFVLVQHLDPSHESMMSDLLSRRTKMRVRQVEGGERVKPHQVYVIPPNATMTLHDGVLQLTEPEPGQRPPAPIDAFFESLARDQGRFAIAIVLSGTGSDGSRGLRAVKEHGGLTLAQEETSAKYGGMPRSAVSTGYVDYVLPVEEMPQALVEYTMHVEKLKDSKGLPELRHETEDRLDAVLSELRERTGHNFAQYKRNTLLRRLERRLQVRKVASADEYLELMQEDATEARNLLQDLLIGVTQFFRDPEAFQMLRVKILPALFEDTTGDDWIRVWTPGCATGEEAYSLAMLLHEHRRATNSAVRLQVFATDIDERALAVARRGEYPASIATAVPEELLGRYFVRTADGYSVERGLRDICIFSPHSVIEDPPFSQVQLVSCRNLMIYLNSDLQRRVLSVIHYALGGTGYLFLGSSEGISAASELFGIIDKKQGLYRAREHAARPVDWFPKVVSQRRKKATARRLGGRDLRLDPTRIAERIIFEEFAPAAVIIDSDGQVLRFMGATSTYLEHPAGEPTLDVIELARRGTRMGLRSALHRARKTGKVSRFEGAKVSQGDGVRHVDIVVRPVDTTISGDPLYIVVFEEAAQRVREAREAESATDRGDEDVVGLDDDPVVRQLEDELRSTRDHLQSAIEELETSNEELRSSNEELVATNEELQSTNEELESSQEELRSVNEELETVNAELSSKLEELGQANLELQNLYESSGTATVFLAEDHSLQGFTPSATELFSLRKVDLGRPFAELASRFDAGIVADLLTLDLDDDEQATREIQTSDERTYLARALPYRSLDGDVVGTTLTFTEVTTLRRAKEEISGLNQALQERIEQLQQVLDVVPVGVLIADDVDCAHVRTNRRAASILGLSEDANVSVRSPDFAGISLWREGKELEEDELPLQLACLTGVEVGPMELTVSREGEPPVELLIEARPIRDEAGRVVGSVAAFEDVTEINEARLGLQARARQQEAVAELGLLALATDDLDELFQAAVDTVAELLEVDYTKILELYPADDELLLRSGVGWQEGLAGSARVGTGPDSQAGYTLASDDPVVVEDLRSEARFSGPALLTEHGVISGLSVIIRGRNMPWGVFGAHATRRIDFTQDDVNFLVSVANVVATTIEQFEAEAELRSSMERLALQEAQQRLRRAERLASLGTLAAGIAHEINNPLTAIMMTAENALADDSGAASDGRDEDVLERILQQAERCGAIVRSVLRFAREDEIDRRPADLNDIVREAVTLTGSYAEGRAAQIKCDLADDLPVVEVNPAEVLQVVLNVLQNAVESHEKSAQVLVATSVRDDQTVCVTVQDNGRGIEPDVIPKIFDPFFSTRRDEGGTGLGLSIAHSIMAEHGGYFDVRSEPSVGSTFFISFPVATEA